MQSFHLQLSEEIEDYERLKRGDLGEVYNLHGLGRMLIALRRQLLPGGLLSLRTALIFLKTG
ncbi:MAG TPA: hypothetical protein VE954_37235 [Oligoflexus sp.]|uniref:hypothetical protein n=1 Tax=Oligoflexus sp. TaxID=1971216 RepID=UPI002D6446FE|nr:hypothetical protein [Oligoflexus sp.]HYX38784.1 hypothetical protein [Oligoflexus sp.]